MFTFASEVAARHARGAVRLLHPRGRRDTSLADFVHARLPRHPSLGDRISLEDIALVVRGMHGERITRIGLDLELHGRAAPA